MFCVECGREGKLYNNLCESCFRKKTVLVNLPEIINVSKCLHCNSLFIKKWFKSKDIIRDAISSAIKYHDDAEDYHVEIKLLSRDEGNADVSVKVSAVILGLSFRGEYKVKVKIKNAVCSKCSKKFGKYYEAIVQVRAADRGLNDTEIKTVIHIAEKIVEAYDTFVSDYEKMHNGLDLYIGSMNAGRMIAKSIADKYCAKHSESPKLVGRKKGEDVYRVTFAVRLPKYKTGDFVYINGKVLMIKKILKSGIIAVDLENHVITSFKRDEIENAKPVSNAVKNAVVVSESKDEVQILDPENYKTITLKKPKDFKAKETVKIIKYRDNVFLVP